MTWLDRAELFNKVATPLIAAFGAVYVLREYRRNARWKAGDLAARLLAQLGSDEDLAFSCHALDYGTGPLIVPVRYRPLLADAPTMEHNPQLMATAMKPRLQPELLQTEDRRGLIYRYAFDRLFTFLQDVDRLQVQSQLRLEDLQPLRYWLQMIASYPYASPISPDEVFQPFLRAAGYEDVIALGRKLGVTVWAGSQDS